MTIWNRGRTVARATSYLSCSRRCLSITALERRLSEPVQSYISTSADPYLNLSIEHYFLQKAAAESAVLFLYVNRPSIIIGRNQNPWLEVNLALLDEARDRPETEPPGLGAVDLVRRRSGGGTVFHDEGNVNWTVICPATKFTRDTHAEMVVRALRQRGVDRARVNKRHDIVLDQGERSQDVDSEDTHITAYGMADETGPRPLKVSGSAYKLTRNRALHHGTCLLCSSNLNIIPHYLHSPTKPYMTARGVESVSSPVGNILLRNEEFTSAVQQQFEEAYSASLQSEAIEVGEDLLDHTEIRKGYEELKSLEWTYLQTPQFILSSLADDSVPFDLELTARHGAITGLSITSRKDHHSNSTKFESEGTLSGQKLHEIKSWDDVLPFHELQSEERSHAVAWLKKMLPESTQ